MSPISTVKSRASKPDAQKPVMSATLPKFNHTRPHWRDQFADSEEATAQVTTVTRQS